MVGGIRGELISGSNDETLCLRCGIVNYFGDLSHGWCFGSDADFLE